MFKENVVHIEPLQQTGNCHCCYIHNWIKDAENKCKCAIAPVVNTSTTN